MIVVVDKRKRVTLGEFARHGQYLLDERSDGVLILMPARVLTVEQFDALQRQAERGLAAQRAIDDEPPF